MPKPRHAAARRSALTKAAAATTLASAVVATGIAGAAPALAADDSRLDSTVTGFASKSSVYAGDRVDVRAELSIPGGVEYNRDIRLSVKRAGHDAWSVVRTIETDSSGTAPTAVAPSADSYYRFTYDGSPTTQSAYDTFFINTTPRPDSAREKIVDKAASLKGTPYVYGATGPSSFDCSGFTGYVYKHAVGKTLPRVSRDQYSQSKHISRSDLAPGDLIFDTSGGSVHHVGIYAGGGKMWHAPHTGDVVRLSSLDGRTGLLYGRYL